MSSAAQKLLDLEADGFVFSRNRNFDGYADPNNRDALFLLNRLNRLADLLKRHLPDDLSVEIRETDDHVELDIDLPIVSGRYMARLTCKEARILFRDEQLATALRDVGVAVPELQQIEEPH